MKNSNYSDWSKEDFIKEIKKLKDRKRYGIVWEEEKTKEKFDKDSEGKLPILKEVKSKEIQTGKNSQTNILIEGDNYHSLSVLNYTHAKQVDVIYIDPPYNIGSEFRYNDRLVDLEDHFRHSKWLSYMKKRLVLARNLLKNSGVIFISIDDNEFSNLKLLCDEIFKEQNFIANLVWEGGIKNDSKFISQSHDYILCYTKNKLLLKENKTTWRIRKSGIDLIYGQVEQLRKKHGKDYSKISSDLKKWFNDLPKKDPVWEHRHYDEVDELGVYFSGDISWPGGDGPKYEILHPVTKRPVKIPAGGWRYSKKETMMMHIKANKVNFGTDEKTIPTLKRYLHETEGQVLPSVLYKDRRAAKKMLDSIMGSSVFENPKDVEIIQKLIRMTTEKDDLILDFFAGSGTTGQAVLELNKEDDGNRKFILCTNNENEICTEVCYPRVKKVIQGYANTKKKKVKGLGSNLKYFKTDFVDGEPTDKNKKKLVEQCTEMLCLKDDCFDEIKQTKTYSIFKNHEEKYLGIIYDDDGIEPLKKQIKSTGKKFNMYVFSLDGSAREEEFEDVKGMVDLKPIPEVILNVYRRIFR